MRTANFCIAIFFSIFFTNKIEGQKFNFHVGTGINVLRPQIRLNEAPGLKAVYQKKGATVGQTWDQFADSAQLKNKYSRFDLNIGVRLTADDDENPLYLEIQGGISPYGTNWYAGIGTGVNIRWAAGPGYIRFQGGYMGLYDQAVKDGDPISLCIRNKDYRHDTGAILEKENPGSLGSPWAHMVFGAGGYDISIGDGFLGLFIKTAYDMQSKKYRSVGFRRNIPFTFGVEFSMPLFAM